MVPVGILVVLGVVFGGYILEHGDIAVLIQPAEVLIIGGAALGTSKRSCSGMWKCASSPCLPRARNWPG
jgi:flagellar motor component MotA